MSKKGVFLVALLFGGMMFFAGCNNNASDEEMTRLNNLKAQNADMEKQINAKNSEKNDLQKQIADRDEKLKQCQADQDEAKKALGK
jgi:septal ring factor EnvC (AmiA/AmiB activator)